MQSFAAVAAPDARVLILGSMPGVASLTAGRYYAHAQNQFWRINGALLAAGPELPYEQRLLRLQAAGVALWDVFASCVRAGSLDADIKPGTIVVNDLAGFLRRHAAVRYVLFNGAAAEQGFRRRVLPRLDEPELRLLRLPSTSPANAAITYERKLALWRTALEGALGTPLPADMPVAQASSLSDLS